MRCSRDIATQIAAIVPDYETQLLVDLISFIKNQQFGANWSVSVGERLNSGDVQRISKEFNVSSLEMSNMTQLQHIIMNHISEINVQWKADVLDIFYNQ